MSSPRTLIKRERLKHGHETYHVVAYREGGEYVVVALRQDGRPVGVERRASSEGGARLLDDLMSGVKFDLLGVPEGAIAESRKKDPAG